MKETKFIWSNGRFVAWEKATTHVLTHALNYGTGIFEGLRCYPSGKTGAIFRLEDHVKRFFLSGKKLNMRWQYSVKDLCEAIIKTVRKNKNFDVYIRPLAFYGYEKLGPNPANSPVNVIIACIPLKDYLKNDFIHVKTSKLQRISPRSCYPQTKITGMYFNSALASLQAWQAGCDEAIMTDETGNIAEGAAENIFMVKNGCIFTPPEHMILPGITRKTLMEISRDLGFEIKEKKISLRELKKADEIFFTGTAVEIHSIGCVDGVKISRKNPITQIISTYYQNVIRGEVPKYKKWLTEV